MTRRCKRWAVTRRPDALSRFGHGLGSALIVDNVLEPMELAHLPYKKGRSYEAYVGLVVWSGWGKRNGAVR